MISVYVLIIQLNFCCYAFINIDGDVGLCMYSFATLDISLSNSTIVGQDNVHPKSSTPIGVSIECQFRKLCSHKNCQKAIRCIIINCNGLKSQSKQAAFCASFAHHNPDIIFGCE